MTLLIDAGNSAIKWAKLAADGSIGAQRWQLHRGVSGITEHLAAQWRNDVAPDEPVVACNVAGADVAAAVETAARALQLRPVRWLRAQQRFDGAFTLVNGYRDPAQLGADRWHCMLGACAWLNARGAMDSLVVVNAGTATTADCVDASVARADAVRFAGRFIGGAIAPGVRLMLESLARRTAGLPAAGGEASDFPDNTDAAIVTGVLDAQAGLVHQIWRRFAERLSTKPRLVLTGGNAQALRARLTIDAEIEDNLVLRGLALRAVSESFDP